VAVILPTSGLVGNYFCIVAIIKKCELVFVAKSLFVATTQTQKTIKIKRKRAKITAIFSLVDLLTFE
jgi:hypothetical protein